MVLNPLEVLQRALEVLLRAFEVLLTALKLLRRELEVLQKVGVPLGTLSLNVVIYPLVISVLVVLPLEIWLEGRVPLGVSVSGVEV